MNDGAPLALVTGGLHRIGAAIAARLAAAGYALVLHRHRDAPPDVALSAALDASGATWTSIRADLSAPGGADVLFDAATAAFDRAPHLIVNNASLFQEGDRTALTAESLNQHLTVNLTAPVVLAQRLAAAGHGDAAVVNILDQRVLNPVPDQIAYTLAKQALWQATRTLARAMAPRVRVNAVAPGLTMPTPDYEPGRMERMALLMPLERLAEPADIADAVHYLATARAVTGQTIFVDGGASLTAYPRDFAHL